MPRVSCPHCRGQILDPVHHAGIEIDACVRCGGLWFEHRELDLVVADYDPKSRGTADLVKLLGEEHSQTSLPCPHCKATLSAHRFQPESSLVLDFCNQCHGIWLEHGELAHAQAGHQLADAIESIDKKKNAKTWLFQFFFGLPVEFNIQPRRFPAITTIIIGLNLLVFVVDMIAGSALAKACTLFPNRFGEPVWFASLVTQ